MLSVPHKTPSPPSLVGAAVSLLHEYFTYLLSVRLGQKRTNQRTSAERNPITDQATPTLGVVALPSQYHLPPASNAT